MSAPIFVFRHAESQANSQGLIISNPHSAINGYGLTERGIRQVALVPLPGDLTTPGRGPILIVSSDFRRAVESAQELQKRLPGAGITTEPGLRERDFAAFEGQDHLHYQTVWDADGRGQDTPGVEAVSEVWTRAEAVATRLRRLHRGTTLILVSHGDVLQILLTGWRGEDPYRHRGQPPLGNAEFRALTE